MRHVPILMAACLVLTACGAAPGTPALRTTADRASDPMIPGCQNLEPQARTDTYITNFYLTTWSSALAEGAMQGLTDGPAGLALRPTAPVGVTVNRLPSPTEPFCRSYSATPRQASAAVAAVMLSLGGRVVRSDINNGLFETEFVQRQHAMARWRDNYVVRVSPFGTGAAVRVLRTVFISRDGGRTYNQGVSVGNNEAYILTQVGDRLR